MNIFITGSTKGLGQALAEAFIDAEETVYGLGRSEIKYPNYHYRQVDISDFKSLSKQLTSLLYGVKQLDVVVLNAGILGRIQDISLCSTEQLQKEMDVNMWANKVILDFLIEHHIKVGQVIAISSGASINGSLGWNGYSLSKAALNMLIKLYAAEVKETHFTALAPGLVKTDMLDAILHGDHDTLRYTSVQRLRDSEKEGLVLDPKEVAQKIINYLPKLLELSSGDYVDLREL